MKRADERLERAGHCAAQTEGQRRALTGLVPYPKLAPPFGPRWLSCIAFVVASFTACAPAPAPEFGSGLVHVPASGSVHRQERAMFDRLNRDRKAQGLSPL